MEQKTFFELEIKELSEEGKFSGYLSTFGNIDEGKDVVDPGAFKKTLREKKAFPFLWAHQGTPEAVAGSFIGKEDEKGLFIEGGFFLDLDGGLNSYKTAKKLKAEGVKLGLSMGYKTVTCMYDTVDGIQIRRLKEVKLKEGSITLWPMNEEAVLETIKEEGEEEIETKPYPNEHACRLHEPGGYERFARMKRKHNGKEFSVIIGFKKGGGSEDQAYRYPKETWSAAEAGAHCKDHKGSFEAALKGKSLTVVCKACGETLVLTEPAEATQPGAESLKTEPGEFHSALRKIADELKK